MASYRFPRIRVANTAEKPWETSFADLTIRTGLRRFRESRTIDSRAKSQGESVSFFGNKRDKRERLGAIGAERFPACVSLENKSEGLVGWFPRECV